VKRSSRRIAAIDRFAGALAALLFGAIAATAGAQTTGAAAPDPAEATRVVEALHAAMLGAMKEGKALGFEGRFEKLQPEIVSRYDFPFIAEKSVGLAWKDFDASQRAQLVDAMERLAAATYAARMTEFDGERFETVATEPASQATTLVRTRIVDPGGEAVPLDYRLRTTPSGPRIVDVFYDGTVSELAMRRSEYSSLLKKGGFPALLDALEKKITEQATATTKPS
jgi:phospholipid transport system substrate-binding protein